MKLKKGADVFLLSFIVLVMVVPGIFSLGLTPAIAEVNYEPGLEFNITYTILTGTSDGDYVSYVDGDFMEFANLSKTEFHGGGGFVVSMKLPDVAKKPGPNRLYVRAKSKPKGTGLGAVVDVGSLIKIHVPYPGKYAEITYLDVEDVNEGEDAEFKLGVASRGKENLTAKLWIELTSEGELVSTIDVGNDFIIAGTSKNYQIRSSTSNYPAGIYNATAYVEFSGAKVNKSERFRVGTLSVEVFNHTKNVSAGKINPFEIYVLSKWNSDIDKIYALVNLSNASGEALSFKTTPTNLIRWEKSKLDSYLNAENLAPGNYETTITLYYDKDSTSVKNTFLEVRAPYSFLNSKKFTVILTVSIMVGVIVIIAILFFILNKILSKKHDKEKK
jgi:hypothetical protein